MRKRPIPECFIQQAMEAIGGKWRVLTVRALSRGSTNFGALRRAVPTITERMLALTLRQLQDDGLIERIVECEKPLRVSYAFTALGKTLIPLSESLYEWGTAHGPEFIGNRLSGTSAPARNDLSPLRAR